MPGYAWWHGVALSAQMYIKTNGWSKDYYALNLDQDLGYGFIQPQRPFLHLFEAHAHLKYRKKCYKAAFMKTMGTYCIDPISGCCCVTFISEGEKAMANPSVNLYTYSINSLYV